MVFPDPFKDEKKPPDQDVKPIQANPEEPELELNYTDQLSELWENLKGKLGEKMSDSRKIMCDELMQLQGRHRQFYKIQFSKSMLDKFEPSR